jgi:transposase
LSAEQLAYQVVEAPQAVREPHPADGYLGRKEPFMLGVDIARTTFTAARWAAGESQRLGTFPNTAGGFAAFAAAVPADERALTLEPTGGYELRLATWAVAQGWTVHLPNPAHVRAWAVGRGQRAKTDRQDARVLARYGAECAPPVWQPLGTEVSELDDLLHRREDLEQMLRQERNRQQALAARPHVAPAVPSSVQRVIDLLDEELRQVEEAIRAHLQAHTALQETAAQLQTVPGIGARTVLPLLVTLGRWHARTAGQGPAKGLVAYAGLDPVPYESGTSVHRHATISRQGNRALRSRLYWCALGAIRGDNPVRAFYHRLVAHHKAKKLALVAAARKILVWAWAVYRQQSVFDPSRAAAAA